MNSSSNRVPIEADEDHEALYTLEYQQPGTGKLFFLEEFSMPSRARSASSPQASPRPTW